MPPPQHLTAVDTDVTATASYIEELAASPAVTLDDVMTFVRDQRVRHRQPVDRPREHARHALVATGDVLPDNVERAVHEVFRTLMTRLARRHEVHSDLPADVLARWPFHAIHAPSDVDDDPIVSLVTASIQ